MFSSTIMFILSMFMLFMSLMLLMKNTLIHINIIMLSMFYINMPISFILDWMSLMFMSVVILISSMISMFSMFYIPKKEQKQFNFLLMMFILSMILLIISDNLLFMMLGWDGLGLSSYVLVVYYQNFNSASSGSITIFTNRIGDILIILSMGIMMMMMNWNFSMENYFPLMMVMMLTLAACTKSAQFPFSAWLPAAMAAPTPISALVHSSTLVTAGVYLLIRISNNPHIYFNSLLMMISSMTALYSSMSALWEQDMKKIIALSTLSQIAMMMFAISINSPMIAFFHLITHALFKSTMFLCAGIMIHNSSYQDMRMMLPLFKNSPITSYSMGVSSMALMGFPFTSGFFSKDMIIENTLSSNMYSFLSLMMLMSVMLTSMYSIRMMFMSTKFSLKNKPLFSKHDNIYSNLPISIMTPLSMILGTMMIWTLPINQSLNIPNLMKMSILLMMLMGIILSLLMNPKNKKFFLNKIMISLWFSYKYSTNSFNKMIKNMIYFKKMDMTWQEMYGPQMFYLKNKNMSLYPDMMLLSSMMILIMICIIPISIMT